jgi:hypothetical protein
MTLIPITFGVGYATVYDLSLNAVGAGMSSDMFTMRKETVVIHP